ncbi:MAG: hypothetical protein HC893_01815 [Chloroflexaceae bacterium]|nr:hypothetical protein [Chloroflexaceae bacterium]
MARLGRETRQNSIRLKNLHTAAEERLVERGMRPEEVRRLLQPMEQLIEDTEFLQHQNDGLAIFLSPDAMHTFRLPLELDELLVVGNRFHIKPMLPMFTINGRFYILTLSQNNVRLFCASRSSIDEIALPEDMPTSLEEALALDDDPEPLHKHREVQHGPLTSTYHGQIETRESIILQRYFLEVDRGIQEVLHNEKAPLILAGTENLLPHYHTRNNYPHLIEQAVMGNLDHLKAHEVHAQAWEVMDAYFQDMLEAALDRYIEAKGSNQSSSDLRTIVPAAIYGRVDTLFVTVDRQQWGKFDTTTNNMEIHAEPEDDDVDLLDEAAAHTLLNSGTVYALPLEFLPDGSTIAAIFRYVVEGEENT